MSEVIFNLKKKKTSLEALHLLILPIVCVNSAVDAQEAILVWFLISLGKTHFWKILQKSLSNALTTE